MASPIILTTHNKTNPNKIFRKKFFDCFTRNPRRLYMVVPYLGRVDPWGDIKQFSHFVISRRCKFFLVTQPPGDSSSSISRQDAIFIENMGGRVVFRAKPMPTLHSKIYQFFYSNGLRSAFVGSANFSKRGFYTNDEIVAFSEEKDYNDEVAREIKRLADNSINCEQWKPTYHVKS